MVMQNLYASGSQNRYGIASGMVFFPGMRIITVGPGGFYNYLTIGAALTYAATLTPSATNRVEIWVAPGVYDEAVTMVAFVDIHSMGGPEQTSIQRADATILTLASNSVLDGFTLTLVTPTAARDMIVEGGVPTARTGVVLRNVIFAITTPGAFAHRVLLLQAASSILLEDCQTPELGSIGGTGATAVIRNDTAGATIQLRNCDFNLANATAMHVFSNIAGTWTVLDSSFRGTASMFGAGATPWTAGTWRGSGNRYLTTGISSINIAAAITEKSGPLKYEVWAGMRVSHAITAAAADTPAPAAANRYLVLVHEGTYDEALVTSAFVDVTGADATGVIITQSDATIMTLASNVRIESITLDLSAPSAARNMVIDNAVAVTGVVLREIIFVITTPGAFDHRGILLTAASSIILRASRTTEAGIGGTGATAIVANTTAGATITLELNDFVLNNGTAMMLLSTIGGTWRSVGNIFRGTGWVTNSFTLGTYLGTGNQYRTVRNGSQFNIAAAASFTEKSGPQSYVAYSGMVIQHAIAAAAADTPAPSAAVPYVVFVNAGIYTEAITGSSQVRITGVGPRNGVIIRQADATVLTLGASDWVLENVNLDLNLPTVARNVVVDGGVARTGIVFKNVGISIATPGGFAHRAVLFSAASAMTWEEVTCDITDGANPGIQLIRNDTAGATLELRRCLLRLLDTAGFLLFSNVAGAWTLRQNSLAGSAGSYSVSLGTVVGTGNVITTNAASAITGGEVTEKSGRQQYEVYAGMVIQHAITRASTDTPTPAATAPYTIKVHPGVYNSGALVNNSAAFTTVVGESRDGVIIERTDGEVARISANGSGFSNLTLRLVTPTLARQVCTTSAANPAYWRDITLLITTPGGFSHTMLETEGAAADIRLERVRFSVTDGANPGISGVTTINSAAQVTLTDCDMEINDTAGFVINALSAGSLIRVVGSRLAGTARHLRTNNATATARSMNSQYNKILRTLGNIVDDSPYMALAQNYHGIQLNWAALDNVNSRVAVGGAVALSGGDSVRMRVDRNAADVAGVDQLAEAAGALSSAFNAGRTPDFRCPFSVSAFDANARQFWGIRATLGNAVPGAAEIHAGFDWNGANFRASSSDGAGVGVQTNLTTPTTGAQHQLRMVVLGGLQVEFYVDGTLVATHATVAGLPTGATDWAILSLGNSAGGALNIDLTLRQMTLQECPS